MVVRLQWWLWLGDSKATNIRLLSDGRDDDDCGGERSGGCGGGRVDTRLYLKISYFSNGSLNTSPSISIPLFFISPCYSHTLPPSLSLTFLVEGDFLSLISKRMTREVN